MVLNDIIEQAAGRQNGATEYEGLSIKKNSLVGFHRFNIIKTFFRTAWG